jgi:undecaprenyl diphosphate synthase
MDGNGRWARSRGLSRLEGHRAGVENIRSVVEALGKHGVKYVTLYAFSTENWERPKEEVEGLLGLLEEVVDQQAAELHEQNVKIVHLGSLDPLPLHVRQSIARAQGLTCNNTGLVLCVAWNYGGRAEILEAVRRMIGDKVPVEQVNEVVFRKYLTTDGIPDPDLVIRTAGEQRLSNFLLWQTAYSEYYFTPIPWPDFGPDEVAKALGAYARRKRRFGTVTED